MKDATVRRLLALDQEYTEAVDPAAEDRDDLAAEFAGERPDAAAKIMIADSAA